MIWYTVNDDGIITDMQEQEDHHRYFDTRGNELLLNDAQKADKRWLTSSDIAVGDRFFMNVSENDVKQAIGSVSQNLGIIISKVLNMDAVAYGLIARASYDEADFTFSFLTGHYDANRNPEFEHPSSSHDFDSRGREENLVNFRFEGSSTIYNHFDAGNFMWGAWTKGIGLNTFEARGGAHLNEFYRLGDSKADQRAISAGRNYIKR
jgi:hypothetical protein